MGIPEPQLETWSHSGAVSTAQAAHESIRNALNSSALLNGKDFKVYLQGSYKNDTNIYGESDVDVVAQLNSTFQHDLSALSREETVLFQQSYPNATYLWQNFREDVLQSLRTYYGSSAISEGNKSLKVAAGSGRLPADVVVCQQYRKYLCFPSSENQRYIEGIVFYTLRENRHIINFPEQHYNNGVNKNAQNNTNGWFKPAVRIFKNMRTHLVDNDIITKDLAPSHCLECLIYNAPNHAFGINHQTTVYKILKWFETVDLDVLPCQHGQLLLFGNSPDHWSIDNAHRFINQAINLWNTW